MDQPEAGGMSRTIPPPGLEPGSSIVLAGRVGPWESRRKKSGEVFVKAYLSTEDGSRVRCVWWEARRAPRQGARVRVRGEVRAYGGEIEIHVRDTVPLGEDAPTTFEHRLLCYYVACVEAEQMRQVEFEPADLGRRFVVVTQGQERFLTGEDVRADLPDDPAIGRWCQTRIMAGPGEQSYAGYPLVVADREREGRTVRVLGPLFFVPVSLRRAGTGYEALLDGSYPELNVYALDLLGIDREEREGLVSAVEELEEIREAELPLERIRAWLDILRAEGLIDPGFRLRPEALEPMRQDPGPSNTAILYGGERGAVIHHLVQDLEELSAAPVEDLRCGPLGILLGAGSGGEPVPAAPQPAVLPTNLAQDQAISNALERPFTVVTGPPGTGKSQVLVNTIAAAMARGESVLFASKNNQAVDVVFERLARVAGQASPIRAGAARFRGQVAQRMSAVLARPREPVDLAGALEDWRAVARELTPIYEQAAERAELERRLEERDAAYAEALRKAPAGAERIERPEKLLAALEQIESLLPVTLKRPRFLPWAKARWQRAVECVEQLWAELRAGTAAAITLAERPEPTSIAAAAEVLRSAVQLADLRRARDEVTARLAALPERGELRVRLWSAGERRNAAARRLFRAVWSRCLSGASSSARAAAERFAEGFARLGRGESGGVRRLLELVPHVLSVFPVWGVTNLSARGSFPLRAGLFDLVVIDEASQCDIPSAIPLLYRAKRALIIGDPKQLIHVTSLRVAADEALARRWKLTEEESDLFSYSRTSLFGLASRRVAGAPLFLDEHFRSRLAIIAFSNDHFYGSRLEVLTDESKGLPGPEVQWIDVRGRFARGPRGRSVFNEPEAQAVVEVLVDLVQEELPDETTIGVVTPYRAQAEAIRERVMRAAPELAERLTVASAHRFQGDERDVMVFSPAVSGEMPEYHLSFAANPNLVNVAITRARWRLVVVGDREACLASGTVLTHLVRYIDDLTIEGFRSPCERELYDALVAEGIPVRVGLQFDGRILDLAVFLGDVKIDIEVDGAAYHRDARADAIRDRQLREAGWHILRFSAREVRRDPVACARRVKELVAADPGESPP